MQTASFPKPINNIGLAPKVEATGVKSRSYTDAYRYVLSKFHQRFVNYLFFFSLAFAIFFQTGFTLNYHNVLSTISYKTFFFALLLFTIGVFIYTIRNLTFTVWEPTFPSYITEFISCYTSLDSLCLVGFYTASSLVIIRTYFSWIMGEKYTSEFLLQPPGHYLGARQLNQENIFICVYAVVLSVNYTFHYIMNRKYIVKINNVQQPFHYEIKTSFATIACSSAIRALKSFRNAYFIYVFCNGSIYYYVARFFGFYNKVLDSPIVGFRWIDLHLFLRLIVAGTLTTCLYNIANRLFEATYSYTLPLTDPYQNQFDCLIEGLAEKERDYIKVAAFSELALLSTKRPEKRVQLFNTVGRELQDSAWYKIMSQCFNTINEFRTKMDIEYNGIQPAAAPVPVSQPVEQKIGDRLEFSTGNVFTSAKKNQIYYDDRTSTIFSEPAELAEHELNATVPSAVENIVKKTVTNFVQHDVVKMLKVIELKCGYAGIFEYFYGETTSRRVQAVFNQYQLVIWAVQALGSLTASSLKEDPFGYVQNDINIVLNTLLGCLVDVENFVKAPPAQYATLLKENVVCGEPEAVKMALREAIYQITTSFSEYTNVFQIDGKYVAKWERFLNYQE